MTQPPRRAKRKPSDTPAAIAARARRAAAKEEKPVPEVDQSKLDEIAAQVAAGKFRHDPQYPAPGSSPPDRGMPLDPPPEPPGASVAADQPDDAELLLTDETPPSEPVEAPPHLVRMVHEDPRATSDGFAFDDTGAILVPHANVEELKSMGFRVQHKREIGR